MRWIDGEIGELVQGGDFIVCSNISYMCVFYYCRTYYMSYIVDAKSAFYDPGPFYYKCYMFILQMYELTIEQ